MLKTNLLKKLFTLYTLLIVVCCIFVNIIVYLLSYSRELSDYTNTITTIERNISNELTGVENNTNNIMQQIYTNSDFFTTLHAYCTNSFSDYERYRLENYIENNSHSSTSLWYNMNAFLSSTPSISSISVYSSSLNRVTTYKRDKKVVSSFLPDGLTTDKIDYIFDSLSLQTKLSFPYYKEIPLRINDGLETFGHVVFEYSINTLEQLITNSPYLVDYILDDSPEDFSKLSTMDTSYIFPWGNMDLKLKLYFSNDRLYGALARTVFLSLLISFFVVVGLLLIFGFILKKMDGLFIKILALIHRSQMGELSYRIDIVEDNNNELTVIAAQLNKMNEELDHHIKTVYVAETKQKQAYILALQNQVNPHFLYNTLEVIRMHALKAGNREIGNQISHLSRLHRNLVKGESHVPLRKELEFCRSYIEIQKIRHGTSFTYTIDCDKQVFNSLVPKFILQPIVENYFKYSLDLDTTHNILAIQCSLLDTSVKIVIRNHGMEVTSDNLDNIQRLLTTESPNESIGLRNVQERIRLQYGDSYGIKANFLPPRELIFTLILPLDILTIK